VARVFAASRSPLATPLSKVSQLELNLGTVLYKDGEIEYRQYESYVVAETVIVPPFLHRNEGMV
jgi:hypothetical protein